jgi:hypothetical protein
MTKVKFENFHVEATPVADIHINQWFTGNPKFPQGEGLPLYSGAVGDNLYIKTSNGGLYCPTTNVYWPNLEGFVVESFRPIHNVLIKLI